MASQDRKTTGARAAKIAIWTVRHQRYIISCIHRYIWAATGVTLLCGILGLISLEAAIYGIFLGGTAILLAFWVAVERRRTILLNIRDPHMRNQALDAMEAVIGARLLSRENEADACPPSQRPGECQRQY